MSNGFTADECTKIISENFSPKAIAEIITARVADAVKSAKAELIKDTTPSSLVGDGIAKGEEKSGFQKFQAKQNENKPKGEIKFN